MFSSLTILNVYLVHCYFLCFELHIPWYGLPYLFVHSSADMNIWIVPPLAIVNSSILNIYVYKLLFQYLLFISLGLNTRSKLMGCRIIVCLIF